MVIDLANYGFYWITYIPAIFASFSFKALTLTDADQTQIGVEQTV